MPTLKALRNQAFYTQRMVAEALNVSMQTINNWERGKRPSYRYLHALAEFFHVSVQEIAQAIAESAKENEEESPVSLAS